MCDCINVVAKRVTDFIGERNPDWHIQYGAFENQSLSVETGKWTLMNPIKIEYQVKKTGGMINKTHKGNIVCNYCPFCGEKIEKEEAKQNG